MVYMYAVCVVVEWMVGPYTKPARGMVEEAWLVMMLSFYGIRMMAECGRRGLTSSSKPNIHWYCLGVKRFVCQFVFLQ